METRTRRPLSDLPLDLFIPRDLKATLKRPHSPATVLLSPSKRRVLDIEGFPSPLKRHAIVSHDNPARKLDFSVPKSSRTADDETQTHSPSTPQSKARLAPSPDITPRCSDRLQTDNPFIEYSERHEQPSSTQPTPTFATDRTSPHYPGFDVHYDARLIPLLSEKVKQPTHGEAQEDILKENIQPRRKAKKAVTVPQEITEEIQTQSTIMNSHRPASVPPTPALFASRTYRHRPKEKPEEEPVDALL